MSVEAPVGGALAAGERSRTQRRRSDRCSKSDSVRFKLRALPGYGTDGERDTSPLVLIGGGAWQMQHDAAHRALQAGSELEQPLAQGRHLRTRKAGAGGTPTQL